MRNPTVIGAGAYGGDGGSVIDNPYPTYTLRGVAIDVVEGAQVQFTVERAGALALAGSVDWAITAGTPADFGGSLPSGHADFGAGITTFPVSLPTSGNAIVDSTRTFTVRLSNPGAGGALGTPSSLAGTIADDDSADPWALRPSWSAVANSHVETGAPPTTAPTQTAQGVTLHEEASGTTGALLELWWKRSFQATHDFTFVTEYVRSGMPGTSRTLAFFWDTVGDGTSGRPASVPDWTALVQANTAHATGTYLIVDQQTNQAQLWTFDKSADAQVGSGFALTLTQGVRYRIQVKRAGTTVTLTVTDVVAGTSVGNSWTDPSVKRGTADGYFGLQAKGVLCTLENNALVDDGNVVVAAPFSTAPKSARILAWETAKLSTETATIAEGADETAGVRLTAGIKDQNDAHDGQRAIGLVSLNQVTYPGTLQLEYQPMSSWAGEDPLTTNGVFTIVAFHALNPGGGNLSTLGTLAAGEWTANYSPVDAYYSNGGVSPSRVVGGRLSVDTHAYGTGTPAGTNKVRWRFILADGSIPTAIGGVQTFDFRAPGGWTTCQVLIDPPNNRLTFTANWSDGTSTAETMTDPRFGSLAAAANVVIGAYNGRDIKVRNVSWTPKSIVVGPGKKAPFYVPNLTGLTAFPIASNTDLTTWLTGGDYAHKYGLVAKGLVLPARTITSTNGASKTHPCYVVADRGGGAPSTWTAADHENFTNRASIANLTLASGAHFVWFDGLVHLPSTASAGSCVTMVGTDNFVTRHRVKPGIYNRGIYTTEASYRTRIGCGWFDSDGRWPSPGDHSKSGNYGDIDQSFSANTAGNPDFWDCYGNAHVSTLPDSAQASGGMCLYAEPGIDSGNPALTPPTQLNVSQPHSFWRGCHIRNDSKYGVYAKHIPNFVECDGAGMDSTGAVVGISHVFAYRGGSSVGGRMLYLRSQCSPFSPGGNSGTRQAMALQSWYHEVGWCEAVGGCIALYAFCPQHDGAGNVVYNTNPGDANKPLQQARYCDVHHCKGLLVLGATRTDSSFGPEGKLQNVVVSAHEGAIVDDAGHTVVFNGTTGEITSSHPWIETGTGPNACRIFFVDPKGRPARPASLAIARNQAGPGCPYTTPWDGVGQWPKIEDYGSSPYA